MLRLLTITILVAASLAPARAQTTTQVAVDALVVDGDGQPVANAEFADRWGWSEGRWRGSMTCGPPDQKQPLRSDAEGRLRGQWVQDPLETPLYGLSSDQRLAAFAVPQPLSTTHEYVLRGVIVLHAAIPIRGQLRTTIAAPRGPLRISIRYPRTDHPQLSHGMTLGTEGLDFSLPLPPGTYSVGLGYGYGAAPARTAVLEAGRAELDLGPISVPAKPLDLIGEVLPDWEAAGARNVPVTNATLAHFRGRPLLIAFDEWGGRLFNGPAIRPGLAALARHPRRAEFGVVLFDTSMRVREAKPDEPEVEALFPLVRPTDGSRADVHYGSRWAIVVLDPDGRLVHSARDVESAVAALEKQLR